MVFVLSSDGQPLDPCHEARARELLKKGRAAVWRIYPLTIKLKGRTRAESVVATHRLKIDPGSKTTGIAIVQEGSGRVVFAAELTHRGQTIRDALLARRSIRRNRRQRRTRYRPARFDNRRRPEGWLPPSLLHRVLTTETWTNRLRRLCPITALSVELAKFDAQLMENAEISGVEYQRGKLLGWEVRAYLLEKWGRRCAYCGAENVPFEIDHVTPKDRGGSNRVSNLALCCHDCNQAKGNRTASEFGHPEVQAQAKAPLKDAAAVNATRWALYERLLATGLPVEVGTGGRTRYNRARLDLPKAHFLDAAAVGASTPDDLRVAVGFVLLIAAKGRGSRQMCGTNASGFPIRHRSRQKRFFGFQTGDLVRAYVLSGKRAGVHVGRVLVRASGRFDVVTAKGRQAGIGYRYCRLVQHADGYAYSYRKGGRGAASRAKAPGRRPRITVMSDAMQGAADATALDLPEDTGLFGTFPPLFVPQAIADGSQVIRHDGYDVEAWDAAVRDYGKLREAVEGASRRLITALPLFRDVFWSFYKPSPAIGPIVALTPAHAINRQIVEQILGTTEWRQTRAAGTSGDPIASAMATLGVAYGAIQALDAATVADVNRLHELESGAAALFAQATALTDLIEQAEGDRARELFEQAERARAEAESVQAEMEQAAAALTAEDEAREEALRRAARAGLKQAMNEIAEEAEAVRVFGGGYGGGGGSGQQFTAKDRIALAQMVQGSRRLKQMMAIAGRQITIALDVQATKVPYPPTEVAGITFGNDPALLLPSELALLMLPETELLFYKGMAERSLMQWELIGRQPQGQGPVIVAVDESGSMSGPCGPYPKTVWAGGTLLAFLAIARLQKRDLVVLHFAEQGQLRVDVFPNGEGPYQDTLRCAEHFYNGSDTRFEPWMRKATDLVQTSQPKADVIVLTDGLTHIDRTVLAEFNAARKAMEMRSYGVLIGTTQGMGELSLCSDAVLTLDDLSQDLPVLNDIFAI